MFSIKISPSPEVGISQIILHPASQKVRLKGNKFNGKKQNYKKTNPPNQEIFNNSCKHLEFFLRFYPRNTFYQIPLSQHASGSELQSPMSHRLSLPKPVEQNPHIKKVEC